MNFQSTDMTGSKLSSPNLEHNVYLYACGCELAASVPVLPTGEDWRISGQDRTSSNH